MAGEKIPYILLAALLLAGAESWAIGINDDILRIHATIVPRTVLMDYGFRDKLSGGSISVCILSMKKDFYSARNLKKYIHNQYANGLSNLRVTVTIGSYKKFLKKPLSPCTIYYLLPAPDHIILSAACHLKDSHSLIFSYDPDGLKNGAHVSIRIGYHVRPVLNLGALKDSGITLRPAIIKISEFYTPPVS